MRIGWVGSRYLRRWNSSGRVNSDLYQIRSCLVIPVRWESMSRIDTARLSSSSWNSMLGTNCRIGWSQSSLPSSTSRPAATAVNSFVFEAMGTTVCSVNGSLRP